MAPLLSIPHHQHQFPVLVQALFLIQDTYPCWKTLALLREQEANWWQMLAALVALEGTLNTQLAPRAGSSPAREQRVHTWGADKERPPANPTASANRQLLETPSGDPHAAGTDVPGSWCCAVVEVMPPESSVTTLPGNNTHTDTHNHTCIH